MSTPAPIKPEPTGKVARFSYYQLMAYLEQKYHFRSTDFFNSHAYYGIWCAKHGLKANHPDIAEHQRTFQRYSAAADGAAVEPEYANFWHWLLDMQRGDSPHYKSMTTMTLNIPKILATYDAENRERQERENLMRLAGVAMVATMLPPALQQMAIQQNTPPAAGLRPFVKTILGYMQAEFGPVVKLSFKS